MSTAVIVACSCGATLYGPVVAVNEMLANAGTHEGHHVTASALVSPEQLAAEITALVCQDQQ